jgi:hypothetical protein
MDDQHTDQQPQLTALDKEASGKEPAPDESAPSESKPVESKPAESRPDDSKSRAESKPTDQSVARDDSAKFDPARANAALRADLESKFDQQLEVNRELGALLKQQMETSMSLRQSVLAIERTLEGNAAMKKRFEKSLQTIKDSGEGLPDVHSTSRVLGMLGRLQRSGTA